MQAIGDTLQAAGASVVKLSGDGLGAPLLLVGFRGENFLLSLGRSTRAEDWALRWTGQYARVSSVKDAREFLARHR